MPRGSHLKLQLSLIAAAALLTSAARAQENLQSIDIQLFRPAIDSKGYITLNSSQVLRHLDISFGLVVNYSHNPLNLAAPTQGNVWCTADPSYPGCAAGQPNVIGSRFDVINMVTGNLQAAIGLFKHFEVGIGLPISGWNGDTNPNPKTDNQGHTAAQGVGDLGLHLKGRLLNTSRHPVGLGGVVSFTFPTGDKENFLGSGRVGIHPSVVVDKEFLGGRISLALNVGARLLFGKRTWQDTRQCQLQTGTATAECGTLTSISNSQHLTYGLGAAFYLVPQRLSLVAELVGQTGFSEFAPHRGASAGREQGEFAELGARGARRDQAVPGAQLLLRARRGPRAARQQRQPPVRLARHPGLRRLHLRALDRRPRRRRDQGRRRQVPG